MPDHLVEASDASKSYVSADSTTFKVLRHVSCTIGNGDRVALVGPSGSGKSTLMHILGGLISPTSGTVLWPGLGTRDELMPSKVQFVFQSPSLFPALTIIRNVTLPMVLAGIGGDIKGRAIEMLDRFELTHLSEKLPEELSGGQAQRVSMVRALAIAPALVLADEPTGQLDSATAEQFLATVLEVASESRAALILATHDDRIASRLDRLWMIDHGTLITSGRNVESKS